MDGLAKIERVHAWIVVDDDGTEGIPAMAIRGLGNVALMCGDQPGAVEAFTNFAAAATELTGKPAIHYIFEGRRLA